jgi:outer membrane receptor for ferric coprogen and ferric-rhodotorulic acid
LASYQVNPQLRFSLTARNIFDKEYYFGAAGLMLRPGDARNIRLTARYDF